MISATEVAQIVCEIPVRVYLGLATSIPKPFELWHDYLSVPQWQPHFKGQIIQAIPQIFNRADLTIAHLSDIEPKSAIAMREGTSTYERCHGISNMCNSKWLSRVWTAMEYTQSQKLQVILQDYTLVKDHDVYRPFVQELFFSWADESQKQGNAQDTEKMVGMGENLVPWQLGPLELVRGLNSGGIRTTFATAHELLARRCITIPWDFFHALLGILRTNLIEPQLSTDEREAMLQIARSRINESDFSPLFMIPEYAQVKFDDFACGYLDLSTFALGAD